MVPKKKLKRAKITQPQDTTYPELENMLARMTDIQDEGLRGRQEFLALETRVLQFMEAKGIEKYDHGQYAGTPVGGSTAVYDWEGIREKIGPKMWDAILGEPEPDQAKLSALIELGQVKADDITHFIQDKPRKKYVKITRRK